MDVYTEDGLLFVWRGFDLWVWRDTDWEPAPLGSYLRTSLHAETYAPHGRAKRRDGLPDGVPEPPTTPVNQPVATGVEHAMAAKLGPGRHKVFLVLTEDLYESRFGTKMLLLRSTHRERDAADQQAAEDEAGLAYHVKRIELDVTDDRVMTGSRPESSECWTLTKVLDGLSAR